MSCTSSNHRKTRSEQDCYIGQTFLDNIVQGGSRFCAGIESRVGARERERERGRKRGGRGTEGERRREERRGRRRESRHKQGVLRHSTVRSGKRREPPIQGHASNHLHAHKSQSNMIYNTCCSLGGRLLQKWYVLQHNRPPVSRKYCK